MNRKYYHQRIGIGPEWPQLTLDDLRRFVSQAFVSISFQGHLYAGPGTFDWIDAFWFKTGFRVTGNGMGEFLKKGAEHEIFTAVEFIFDHFRFRTRRGTGVLLARQAWVVSVNRYLPHYGDGFYLTDEGEVVRRSRDGLEPLLQKAAPPSVEQANLQLVDDAVSRFQRGASSRAERKLALLDLGKVLEFYREKDLKKVVPRDEEQRLFEFLNTFSVRHNDSVQKDDYDDVWLDWMFYRALATIHLYWDLVHGRDEPLPSEA